jgi:hypothetical protein
MMVFVGGKINGKSGFVDRIVHLPDINGKKKIGLFFWGENLMGNHVLFI